MALPRATTTAKERIFYRSAVQATLQTFYGKTESEAAEMVTDWWKALSESGVVMSPLLLHAEPMNTAADIADIREVAINSSNRDAYHLILEESWKAAEAKPAARTTTIGATSAQRRIVTKRRPKAVPKPHAAREVQVAAS